MRNKRLQNIKIVFLVATIILLSLSIYSYLRINNLVTSSAQLNHTNIVKLELESLFSRIKDADSDQRGFVLTKDIIYLKRFEKTLDDIERKKKNMDDYTFDNYSQQQNLKVLNMLINKRIVYMQKIINDAPNMEITTDRWLMARSIMDDLRKQTDKMMNEEQFLLRLRTKTLIRETEVTPIFAIILTLCSILCIVTAYFFINHELQNSTILRNDLEKKNNSLKKMNIELESFTYISSHDLQEPLRKIQTFISRIIEKDSENLSEMGQTYLAKSQQSANRMQNLIRDLLAYSRLNTEIFPVALTKLRVLVNDIEDDLEEEIRSKSTKIKVEDEAEIKIIVSQFRQLLTNLISNSIKFASAERSPIINISCKNIYGKDVGTELIQNQLYSEIIVADNGIGFDQQYNERIFNVFQRLHIQQEYKGTGIGLAIVKKIVDNHNGFIYAFGELGVGTKFKIYIPA